jgi:hypothetical protein
MSNEKETQKDFFEDLFDTNCHETPKPRVISGGGKISKEMAKALGIKSKQDADCQ